MLSNEEDNTFKISVPIITNEELKRFNNYLETDLDKIVNEISTYVSRDREIILLKKVIEKQSKEIEELKEIYQTGYVNGCVSKVYEINKKWKDKIKAKIEELEKGNKNTFIRGEKILILQSLLEKE